MRLIRDNNGKPECTPVQDMEPGFYVNETDQCMAIIGEDHSCVLIEKDCTTTFNTIGLSNQLFRKAKIKEIFYDEEK